MIEKNIKMMTRHLPLEILHWMEKDVTLKRIKVGSRLTTEECPENFLINRDFFSQVTNLSHERYRKLLEFDFEKKTFLKHQRIKAETTMPGLRPYLKTPSSARSTTTFDSFQSPSTFRCDASPIPPPPPRELSARQKASMERINRLALPKGRRSHSFSHVRSNTAFSLNPNDLFEQLDITTSATKSRFEEKICEDERFHQLVQTCTNIHLHDSTNELRSVESIVQSNSSLQDHEKSKKKKKSIRPIPSLQRIKSSLHLMDIGQI